MTRDSTRTEQNDYDDGSSDYDDYDDDNDNNNDDDDDDNDDDDDEDGDDETQPRRRGACRTNTRVHAPDMHATHHALPSTLSSAYGRRTPKHRSAPRHCQHATTITTVSTALAAPAAIVAVAAVVAVAAAATAVATADYYRHRSGRAAPPSFTASATFRRHDDSRLPPSRTCSTQRTDKRLSCSLFSYFLILSFPFSPSSPSLSLSLCVSHTRASRIVKVGRRSCNGNCSPMRRRDVLVTRGIVQFQRSSTARLIYGSFCSPSSLLFRFSCSFFASLPFLANPWHARAADIIITAEIIVELLLKTALHQHNHTTP